MKKYVRSCLLAAVFLLSAGCVQRAQPADYQIPTNTTIPSIIVDHIMYHMVESGTSVEIPEGEILGYVTSSVKGSYLPEKEGEANCADVGAPYARWSGEDDLDGLAVYYESLDSWTLFIPCEQWHTDSESADCLARVEWDRSHEYHAYHLEDGRIPSILVDETMYHRMPSKTSAEIPKSDILGYITSYTEAPLPKQENEANCVGVNTPYARWPEADAPDGLAVYDGDEDSWTLFIPCAQWHYSPSAANCLAQVWKRAADSG